MLFPDFRLRASDADEQYPLTFTFYGKCQVPFFQKKV